MDMGTKLAISCYTCSFPHTYWIISLHNLEIIVLIKEKGQYFSILLTVLIGELKSPRFFNTHFEIFLPCGHLTVPSRRSFFTYVAPCSFLQVLHITQFCSCISLPFYEVLSFVVNLMFWQCL